MTRDSIRQLALDFAQPPALGRDDFLIASANRTAVELIDRWPDWPTHAAVLVGPPGSGKSHLVALWRTRSGGSVVDADRLNTDEVPSLINSGAVAIENAPVETLDERALFHLLNLAREIGGHVLIAARTPPPAWNLKLADLSTRLAAATTVTLELPDDGLLRGVLVKLFADRQIVVDDPIIAYLLARMPRSLSAARMLVEAVDRIALEERAEVTRPFVARVLAGVFEPALFGPDDG